MDPRRIIAIVIIYLVACGGWMILGTTTLLRSEAYEGSTAGQVQAIWGGPVVQTAPRFSGPDGPMMPSSSVVRVRLDAEHSRKGLLWHPTFYCDFTADYRLEGPAEGTVAVAAHIGFPGSHLTYDRFVLRLDGQDLQVPVDVAAGVQLDIPLTAASRILTVGYRVSGLGEWRYEPAGAIGRVRGLDCQVATDFQDIDFREGSLPKTALEANALGGVTATWQSDDLITRRPIAVVVPNKLNPGPIATTIAFYAPVGLIFFFVLVAAIAVLRRIDIHPMHYLFVACGFGSFHLLFAYLVDHLEINLSFVLAASAAIVLVTTYLFGALRGAFPWLIAIIAQFFFLVLFSYSFFIKGTSGLTIAIGSVVTLAVLMRLTLHVDWTEVFRRRDRSVTVPADAP